MPKIFRQAMLWWFALGLAFLAWIFGAAWQPKQTTVSPQTTLPALSAKLDATSVSGISSGAYMAGQFQMAQAKIVTGAAIIAGGPYGCSESVFADAMPGPGTAFLNLGKAMNGCMLDRLGAWGVADPVKLTEKAKQRADKNEIDSLADVVSDRVYLFSGTADQTVVPSIVRRAAEFYAKVGLPPANIKFIDQLPAGHAFVTENAGNECAKSGAPYVVDCDYDQAGELLQHIYGKLEPRSDTPQGTFADFDQRPFHSGQLPDGLADNGAIYVPETCRREADCRIHIAFHGCSQNREAVGDAFIKESGFSRWADTNKLIIVFPQVETTVSNPQGCWDWWGYTGNDYLTRDAPQIKAVRAMVDALHEAPQS